MTGKEKRMFIRYKLAKQNRYLSDLASHLGLTPDGLYKKLEGKINVSGGEKQKINEYLQLTKIEATDLWGFSI